MKRFAFVLPVLMMCGTAYAQQTNLPTRPNPYSSTAPAGTQGATTPAPASTQHEATRPVSQYPSEAEAKHACGSDPVVWANLDSKVLHPSGDRYYGKTKKGAYVCQKAAEQAGMHTAGG